MDFFENTKFTQVIAYTMQEDDYLRFNGEIIVISSTSDKLQFVINKLSLYKVVGFDTETRPSFKKGRTNLPSLIQLATKNFVILYRINKKPLAKEIIQLLENKEIIKVGTGIRQDLQNLLKLSNFNPASFIDIQELARKNNIENISLKKLSEQLLHKKLSKRQQLSNWEATELTLAQKQYAATDAYACLLLYEKLTNETATITDKKE